LQVIEVGQVGRLAASPAANAPLKLYAHAQQGPGFGNSSSMLAALQAAAQGEASAAKVRRNLLLLGRACRLLLQSSACVCSAVSWEPIRLMRMRIFYHAA
jgi:hypothetical protein